MQNRRAFNVPILLTRAADVGEVGDDEAMLEERTVVAETGAVDLVGAVVFVVSTEMYAIFCWSIVRNA